MPTLRQLEARLYRVVTEVSREQDQKGQFVFRDDAGEIFMWSPKPERRILVPVQNLAEADGISFLCPQAFARNGGGRGTHSVYIWFEGRGAPDDMGHDSTGKPARWKIEGGSGLDDLSLSHSILEIDGGRCGWHGFVGWQGVPAGSAA